ncbi:MAG: hypothetical protein HC838_14725, partial [Spirulinaceae cyanobacterium RM2_2_10]|nr:hypothetical protein [Spirulinaceae cyanobacterium RM2_2_10]
SFIIVAIRRHDGTTLTHPHYSLVLQAGDNGDRHGSSRRHPALCPPLYPTPPDALSWCAPIAAIAPFINPPPQESLSRASILV